MSAKGGIDGHDERARLLHRQGNTRFHIHPTHRLPSPPNVCHEHVCASIHAMAQRQRRQNDCHTKTMPCCETDGGRKITTHQPKGHLAEVLNGDIPRHFLTIRHLGPTNALVVQVEEDKSSVRTTVQPPKMSSSFIQGGKEHRHCAA